MKLYLQNCVQSGSFFRMLYCTLNNTWRLIEKSQDRRVTWCLFTKETAKESNEIFLCNVEGMKILGVYFTYSVCSH